MTPPQLISVLNRSTRVSDDDVRKMTRAVGEQLAKHVAPFYGLVPALEFVESGGSPSSDGALCLFLDKTDEDGALGYHDENEFGVAYLRVFAGTVLDNGSKVLEGSWSVSSIFSHEVLEVVGDAPANRWADGPNNTSFAYELCDAVQDGVYEIGGISVSNFVLQAFFDPNAEKGSRFDYLGKLGRPFAMTSGGYQITRAAPGRVSFVYGSHAMESRGESVHVHFGPDVPAWVKRLKMNKTRTKKRS